MSRDEELVQFHSAMLLHYQNMEAYINTKHYFGDQYDNERATTFHRRKLDESILKVHIATCPFAKQHKHEVGPVEQLQPADTRLAGKIGNIKTLISEPK